MFARPPLRWRIAAATEGEAATAAGAAATDGDDDAAARGGASNGDAPVTDEVGATDAGAAATDEDTDAGANAVTICPAISKSPIIVRPSLGARGTTIIAPNSA
jgi:hypothetical protein